MNLKKQYDVIILDSGVDISHPALCAFQDIDCAAFDAQTGAPITDAGDIYGHATALAGLIKAHRPEASILSLRIFESENGKPVSTESKLLHALQYIYDHVDAKIINMSLEVDKPTRMQELRDITKKLAERGVIQISAFENFGGITYPAAFEWVIGVSIDAFCPQSLKLLYKEDSIINLVAPTRLYRVAWQNGESKFVRGSSFTCAIVSAEALSFMEQGRSGFSDILTAFREKYPPAIRGPISPAQYTANEHPAFSIQKAAAFPFNKEMHSVIRFADELTFALVDVYDIRQNAQVGLTTDEVLKQPCPYNYTIKNIENIDWDSFDTLLLGCVSQLITLFKRTDWIEKIIADALAHGKNIFAFEDISPLTPEQTDRIYYPSVRKENLPPYRDNRLFRTAIPIIGVFGTESQQGKFTIQMLLRKEFKKIDCSIGQIGTEPHALLFGMDFVFANGFNSYIELSDFGQMRYFNDLLRRTCDKLPDIIITGTQKGLVPRKFSNSGFYSRQNYAFLDGIKPDYAILTVSVTDSIDFIERNIHFLTALSQTQTLALVLFPVCPLDEKLEEKAKKRVISHAEYEAFRDKINAEIDIPVLFLNDENLGDQLMRILLSVLTEEPNTET